jgi:hypothetical protein
LLKTGHLKCSQPGPIVYSIPTADWTPSSFIHSFIHSFIYIYIYIQYYYYKRAGQHSPGKFTRSLPGQGPHQPTQMCTCLGRVFAKQGTREAICLKKLDSGKPFGSLAAGSRLSPGSLLALSRLARGSLRRAPRSRPDLDLVMLSGSFA